MGIDDYPRQTTQHTLRWIILKDAIKINWEKLYARYGSHIVMNLSGNNNRGYIANQKEENKDYKLLWKTILTDNWFGLKPNETYLLVFHNSRTDV